MKAGVNFRPAGGLRGQVAGPLPGGQPSTGTRQQRVGAVTPSLHPEVPGIQFVSPGLDEGVWNRGVGGLFISPFVFLEKTLLFFRVWFLMFVYC